MHDLGIFSKELKTVKQNNLIKSVYKLACWCLNYKIKIN
jgi:hypothetical protein